MADSVSASEGRHALFMAAVSECAIDVADRLLRGVALPPELEQAEKSWRELNAGRKPGQAPC